MKKILSVASIAVLLTGCNDTVEKIANFTKPKLRDSESKIASPQKVKQLASLSSNYTGATTSNEADFPTLRTLTDVNGRSIDVKILAKKGNMIAIAKLPSNQQFLLPLEKLAQADRLSLSSFRDGGRLEAFGKPARAVALPATRKAVWHTQISNAEKEATAFGIPLLVAVLVNGSSSAEALEKNLAYSRDFKSWADRNVALCMVRTDGFEGKESRERTYENWLSLQKYGISQSVDSSVVMIDPINFTYTEIPNRGRLTDTKAISQVAFAINEKSKWRAIRTASAPVKADSPFKVASRAVTSNCGST